MNSIYCIKERDHAMLKSKSLKWGKRPLDLNLKLI